MLRSYQLLLELELLPSLLVSFLALLFLLVLLAAVFHVGFKLAAFASRQLVELEFVHDTVFTWGQTLLDDRNNSFLLLRVQQVD